LNERLSLGAVGHRPSTDPPRHLHPAKHVEQAIGLIEAPRSQDDPLGFSDDGVHSSAENRNVG
jgi:hypothetical protein